MQTTMTDASKSITMPSSLLFSKACVFIFIVCAYLMSRQASAAWFESSGQAAILNGDKETAKHQATEEAIKQALLFAGASVSSVQQMTNGLLMDDHIEVRSSGEVNSIEFIDEIYQDDYVTVSIRADIFAQKTQCTSANYTKRIATTYAPILFRQQAADGQIYHLGKALSMQLQSQFDRLSHHLSLTNIEPYTLDWHKANVGHEVKSLASKSNTQYVLVMTIEDIGLERFQPAGLAFWKEAVSVRNFAINVSLHSGASGDSLFQKRYEIADAWEFASSKSIDVNSIAFWDSRYGASIKKILQQLVVDLDEYAACEPTMGRILAVENNNVHINLGQNQKVQKGDQLTLYTVKQIQDTQGQHFQQFILHPTPLIVSAVFNDTATATSMDNSLLGDIQPNDYVARR